MEQTGGGPGAGDGEQAAVYCQDGAVYWECGGGEDKGSAGGVGSGREDHRSRMLIISHDVTTKSTWSLLN